MASALYDLGREGFLNGSIDYDTDTIKVVPVSSGYTPNFATDQYLSSVLVGSRLATAVALSSKTTTTGVADAADITFPAVPAGTDVQALVIYKDTGSDATSLLIAYIDSGVGLPRTPDGGDIIVQWNNGPNKIFKL